MRRVIDITEDERLTLYKAIRETLKQAVDPGGRHDERDLYNKPGGYKRLLDSKAKGNPCLECGSIVEKIHKSVPFESGGFKRPQIPFPHSTLKSCLYWLSISPVSFSNIHHQDVPLRRHTLEGYVAGAEYVSASGHSVPERSHYVSFYLIIRSGLK